MYLIDKVASDFNPRNEIIRRLPEAASRIKMSKGDSAFICGLLREARPRKIIKKGGHEDRLF